MRQLLLFLSCLPLLAFAQPENFGFVSFKTPAGWTKDIQPGKAVLVGINKKNKNWCQLVIYPHTTSKGNMDTDFESEWNLFAVKGLNVTGTPALSQVSEKNNWKQKTGTGSFRFENKNASCRVTSFSNGRECFSIVVNTNSTEFNPVIDEFFTSLTLLKNNVPENLPVQPNIMPASSNNFQFSSTDFDDGWKSIVQENWVEVSKPGIKILIHHPRNETEDGEIRQHEGENKAWNVLVAPRYSNLGNYMSRGLTGWEGITFLTGDATEKQTGRKVHIVLFKKHYANGNGRWLEVVASDQATFEKEFGNNYINSSSWDYMTQAQSWNKLADMQWRNKFAVSAKDLLGKWGVGNSSTLSYYYTNTGNYAGATAVSTADEFTFLAGNKYQSDHTGASGIVGNQKWSRQVYKGQSVVSNWTITLTNRFEGETEKFDCHFEAVKGGRILVMKDRLGTVYSLVKK